MPTYVALLRAINLGARRRFSPADLRAATEGSGATGVETHINTGNVRLVSRRRSVEAVARDLEAAYLADRGFEVPTIVITPAELTRIAADAAELGADAAASYVSFFREEPTSEALAAFEERAERLGVEGERFVVRGRAGHLLLEDPEGFHTVRLAGDAVDRLLGVSTSRNRRVVDAMAQKWGA